MWYLPAARSNVCFDGSQPLVTKFFDCGPATFSDQAVEVHGALVLKEQLDELIEQLEGELASAEIFTALFELELAGRVRQMPGKNYVRSM